MKKEIEHPIELVKDLLPDKFKNPSDEQLNLMNNLIYHNFKKPSEEEIKKRNEYAQGFINDAKRDLEDIKVLHPNK